MATALVVMWLGCLYLAHAYGFALRSPRTWALAAAMAGIIGSLGLTGSFGGAVAFCASSLFVWVVTAGWSRLRAWLFAGSTGLVAVLVLLFRIGQHEGALGRSADCRILSWNSAAAFDYLQYRNGFAGDFSFPGWYEFFIQGPNDRMRVCEALSDPLNISLKYGPFAFIAYCAALLALISALHMTRQERPCNVFVAAALVAVTTASLFTSHISSHQAWFLPVGVMLVAGHHVIMAMINQKDLRGRFVRWAVLPLGCATALYAAIVLWGHLACERLAPDTTVEHGVVRWGAGGGRIVVYLGRPSSQQGRECFRDLARNGGATVLAPFPDNMAPAGAMSRAIASTRPDLATPSYLVVGRGCRRAELLETLQLGLSWRLVIIGDKTDPSIISGIHAPRIVLLDDGESPMIDTYAEMIRVQEGRETELIQVARMAGPLNTHVDSQLLTSFVLGDCAQ